MKLNRKGLLLSVIGIVVIIIYFFISMSTPFHGKNHGSARLKACKCIRELEMRDLKIKISTILYDIFLSPITGLLLGVALIAADIITSTKKRKS